MVRMRQEGQKCVRAKRLRGIWGRCDSPNVINSPTVNQLGTRVDMDHVARILGRWALFSQGHIGFV